MGATPTHSFLSLHTLFISSTHYSRSLQTIIHFNTSSLVIYFRRNAILQIKMKFASILAFGAALSGVNAALKGFNLAGHLASGACRTENDWQLAFERLQTLPGGFPNVRLYASGDCDTLKNAYYEAHDKVVAVSGGKEVWTTETGWPISGATIGASFP